MASQVSMIFDLLAVDRASAVFDKVGVSAEAAGKKAEGSMTAFAGAAGKVAAGASVLAAGLTAISVKMAADFQQSVTKLATTAGESTSNLKMVGDGMLAMAGQVGLSAKTLADGMYMVESAGFHGADALTVLKSAAQGAKQENADLGKVTDAVTTILHDYHLPASEAAKVTSQLVTAVSHGKTTFDELTGAMHSITPLAAQLNIPLADVAGTLSAMTASGESAEQATDNMRNALEHLITPTKPMINELAQLGITATDLQDRLSKRGLAGSMQDISEAILKQMGPSGKVLLDSFNQSKIAAEDATNMFEHLPPAAQKVAKAVMDGSMSFAEYRKSGGGLAVELKKLTDQWLTTYTGAQGFNQQLKSGGIESQTYTTALEKATGTTAGLTVALMSTGENAAATNAAIKDIANSAGDAKGNIKGWDEVQGNFNQKLDEAKASVGALAIQFGEKLLPALTDALGWLNEHGVPALKDFYGAMKDAVDFIRDHSGVFGTLGAVIGGLTGAYIAWTGAIAAWTVVTTAATAVTEAFKTAQVALYVAMMDNPVMLIVVALAALAAGLVFAYHHFKPFRDIVNDVFGFMKNTAKEAIDWVTEHWPLLLGILTGPIGLAVVEIVKHWDTIKNAFEDAWHAVSHFMENLWHDVSKFFSNMWDDVTGFVSGIWHDVTGFFGHLWDDVTGIASRIWHDVVNFFKSLASDVWDIITGVGDRVATSFTNLYNNVTGTAKKIWDGVKGFFGNMRDDVVGIFHDVVDTIGRVWQSVEDIIATPIRWVVDNVYDKGIVTIWNAIAGVLHQDELKLSPFHFASGGVVPGSHGRDDVPIYATPGEVVVPTNVVHAHGGPHALMNSLGFGGGGGAGGHFGIGGIVGKLGHYASAAAGAAGGVVGDVIGDIKHLARGALGAVASPAVHAFESLADSVLHGMGGMGDTVDKFVHAIGDKLLAWIKGDDQKNAVAAPGGAVERWRSVVDQALTMLGQPLSLDNGVLSLIQHESGGDENAINLVDSNALAGHPSKGLTQTIPSTFEAYRNFSLPDDIFDPLANVYAGINYALTNYGPGMLAAGGRHDAGGGYLGYETGVSFVPTTGPAILHRGEAVVPAGQVASMRGSGTPITINVYGSPGQDPVTVAKAVGRELAWQIG